MSLIDEVKMICDRLEPLGWGKLLKSITNDELNIAQPSSPDLEAMLGKSLAPVKRNHPGMEDFHPTANRAITKGRPSHSLLYHVLASPDVHPTDDGTPSANMDQYPTLDELDILENYIYSLVSDRDDLDDTVVAVFSYQYRIANRSSHRNHADLTYSRTGIARVGTTDSNYDASRRSFWVIPENGKNLLPVLPAKYGVFLARRSKPGEAGTVQGGHDGDTDEDFVFPVHKLFAGKECLDGLDLSVEFLEFHRNQKLRKTHTLDKDKGGLPIPDGFDITQFPYVRDSLNGGNLVTLEFIGNNPAGEQSTVLVVPEPGKTLVRTVSQLNSVTNKEQIVHFEVPASNVLDPVETRFVTSSLIIPAVGTNENSNSPGGDRLAPEYVNIRHEIDPAGPIDQIPKEFNDLTDDQFKKKLKEGGYFAAHYIDDSCDGCVEAKVTGFDSEIESLPAFSLVTAPDFFPLADQIELDQNFNITNVKPLSKGRMPVNLSIPLRSDNNLKAFQLKDKTVTAIVGAFSPFIEVPKIGHLNRMVSFLPDSGSDVFAPGWDTSRSRDSIDSEESYLTSSGLGSPFPEDAKLCAALASYWPAVAPDNGRTFGNQGFNNQLPMLDEELGFHDKHGRVSAEEVNSYVGWDGECGPFFETVGGKEYVNYVAIDRSDYVSHALVGKIGVALTANIQSNDLLRRYLALNKCKAILIDEQIFSNPCLVVFRKVENWATSQGELKRKRNELEGIGYHFEFADLKDEYENALEFNRVRNEVRRKFIFQFGLNGVAYHLGGNNPKFKFDEN